MIFEVIKDILKRHILFIAFQGLMAVVSSPFAAPTNDPMTSHVNKDGGGSMTPEV
jgi:hypothetical protein